MKKLKKKIKFIVEKTDTGFSAFTVDYPIFTTGISVSDLINNSFESASLYFEEKGIKLSHENIKFETRH